MFKRKAHVVMILVGWLLLANLLTESNCIYRATVGVPCPGCGLTRAMKLALNGEFSSAFTMHPLWPFIPLTILVLMVIFILGKWANFKHWLSQKQGNTLIVMLAIIVIGVYVIRLILYFPHTEPMTYNEHSLLNQIYKIFIIWLPQAF